MLYGLVDPGGSWGSHLCDTWSHVVRDQTCTLRAHYRAYYYSYLHEVLDHHPPSLQPPSSAALYQAQLSQMKANVTAQTIAKFENHLVLTCQVIMKHSTISSKTRIPKDLKHLITEFWNQSTREIGYHVYSS
jgi:hypothetical protein